VSAESGVGVVDGAARVRASLTGAIALHQQTRDAELRPVVDAAAAIVRWFAAGGKLLVLATAAARPTRSTWRPNWSAASSATAAGWRPSR